MKVLNYEFAARLGAAGRCTHSPTAYRIHKQPPAGNAPKVSIILLDWSCRESLHALNWLQRQDVPREHYELIWIELFDRVLPEAMQHADSVVTLGQKGMYHKHAGYNVGLLLARGDIVTVCDSDAVFPEDFVRSILTAFREPPTGEPRSLVLMHHELRTSQTYPKSLDDASVLKDRGKWQWWDITPNAGACMSVLRNDALRFGGFDECPSYRGYLCGPYDLGWRMVNAGIPEVWHDLSTVLWHFAHPDPVGTNGFTPSLQRMLENTFPHVDLHALTAVEHFSTGRILPKRENPQVHELRMARRQIGTPFEAKYADLTGSGGFRRRHVNLLRAMLLCDLLVSTVGRAFQRFRDALARRSGNLLQSLLGQSMYERLRRWRAFRAARDPILVADKGAYNIVRYRRMYFGVPKDLGKVNFKDDSHLTQPSIRASKVRALLGLRMRTGPRPNAPNRV